MKNVVIDFVWDLREAIKDSEALARDAVSEDLNRKLEGMKIKIACFERVGLKINEELVEHTCVVESVELSDEGYVLTINTDKGEKFVPHPPLGIEVVGDDPKSIHI